MAYAKFNRTRYNLTKYNTSQLNKVLIAEVGINGYGEIVSRISKVTFLTNHDYRKFNRSKFNRNNDNKSLPKIFISGQGNISSIVRKTTKVNASLHGSGRIESIGYRVVIGNINLTGKGDIEVVGYIVKLIMAELTGEGDISTDVFIIYMPSSYVALPTRPFIIDTKTRVGIMEDTKTKVVLII